MINVAIIGAGAIAGVQGEAFRSFPELCQVRAVCDLYIEKAQELIKTKELSQARAYKTMEEAIHAEDIDLVSVCLPPSAHAKTAIQAMELGCHVLVEKPMANSLEECDRMLAASARTGKLLSVVCQNRFKTPMQRIHQMLQDGVGGKVLHAVVNSLWWRGENYYDLWWRGTWDSECGGSFTSHSVHHIDLLLWMLGMPSAVTAVMKNVGHPNSELEDVGMAILEYPESFAHIGTSIVDYGEAQEIVFQTEKGRLNIPWCPAAATPLPNGFPKRDEAREKELDSIYHSIPELKLEGHPAQIKNLLLAIEGKEPLLTDGTEGRKTIELIMAIYKSSALRQTVTLPISEDDDFYRKETMIQKMPHFFEKKKSIENFASTEITLGRDMGK
ncbi:MAG: Gfo/Idh/MocA family oxidoreductase [Lachnospiraceae bacterium]|nr:Gfo/Idh/MocA family oxidoreductase [Lachnospiraceae bacterium]